MVGPIGTFTTTYTTGQGTENRNHNIELVSQILDNSICKIRRDVVVQRDYGDCNEEKGFLGAGAIIDGEYTGRWAAASARLPLRCSMRCTSPVFRSSSATIIRSTSPAIRPDAMRPSRTNLTLCGETTPPAMFW